MSFKVKALYEYTSSHEDDLNFAVGQIITVTDEEDADWYGGEYIDEAGTKHEGIFPRNFVEKYEPTAPPRPTRARPKKEAEPAPAPVPETAAPPVPPPESSHLQAAPEPGDTPEPVTAGSPSETLPAAPPAPAAAPAPPAPKPVEPAQPPAPAPAPAPPAPQPAEVPSASSQAPPKPAPSTPKPSGPPPVSEKPTSSSFKDRIAAFNKASAPPIAPFKPSSLSSGSSAFIKKPFVAPPPSRNAYVPPPTQVPVAKIYRRDEDPEVKEQEAEALENAGKAGLVPAASTNQGDAAEDQPKPMSLKERLALLQKQQMETAARHAEAAAKKEKPKRPPKKRLDSQDTIEGETGERTEETRRTSTDEAHPPRLAHPPRRKSSKGAEPRDGNEADMSGAGETTEGQEDVTEKEDSDEKAEHVATVSKQEDSDQNEEEDEEEEEEDIDPEIRRKEELRARMARMAGGMGMPGMAIPLFGAPAPLPPKKKKAAPEKRAEEIEEPASPTARAAPIPLPGLMRPPPPPEARQPEAEEEEEEESRLRTPHQEAALPVPSQEAPPPIPVGRPAPPPVPTDSRPPPPPPPASAAIKSPSEGSASGDELGESDAPQPVARAPPPPPPAAAVPPPIPTSPRLSQDSGASLDQTSPSSPREPAPSKRNSRPPPPPVPSSPPAPPPAQTRPPPPPPSAAPPLHRTSTGDSRPPPPLPAAHRESDDGEEEEVTEYEGDYDTDIASSVPHKDALKAHQRDSSFEDVVSPRSPTAGAPPIPIGVPPRAGPPPVPSQPPPETRRSVDVPRSPPPPPPPPPKETPRYDDDYDPYNYTAPSQGIPAAPSYPMPTPPPPPPSRHQQEDMFSFEVPSYGGSQVPRSPPPPPPPGRAPTRQSIDHQRPSIGRRSVDVTRPSMESSFVANDIDLASQSGWWLQPNGLPPQLHGRKDIFFESEESSAADPHQGGKTIVTRDIYVLYQDYSQTVITVRFNPQDPSDVHLEQRHEPPPRALRQDQLEQSYERFGRAIGEAAASKKDTIVGDGTPQALVYELLRPFKDALLPVGTRAYGALVYSNLANASTTQNDEIRPGDIVSIRNAKFQGKHGPMHAKYSVEVGKPDHVAIVAEWDGTKKKVRAWEQGRESKKVKVESFKLDDLRSGEVKIWRVMPRSWIGWEANAAAGGQAGN
ncbi:07e56a69-45eb-4dfb-a5b5-ea579eceeae4 [Thermothielavioides terrestris]|uniref:07e56a69-45eb-4dfb-a5b5-ea579eceeae4 n=1 Tax=Thermothielavioides terrestris TaxID=2587410 RepID=A0A3S4AT00_9PEZI|nr:07e56a69-45eb-4dfb-a5b5-ea579eceeae4 [Thermothielavioides terrestris]